MCGGDTILAAAPESSIDENWCLLKNQSTWNVFINGKCISNIRDAPNGSYLHVHFNSGVTHNKTICDLSGYSNHFWYNPKGIANILSFVLVQKLHLVTCKSQYGKSFVVQIPQQPTSNITKSGIFYHNMGHLLKNKNSMHIMVNGSRSPIPQVEENNKQYNACDVNNDDRARQFQHITSQPVKRILHVVDKIFYRISQFCKKIPGWMRTYIDSACHVFKAKQSATRSIMWNLS